MFCTKKQTHGQLSGARQNFHTESDVFYGDLVKFSLYFFLHVTMYTRRDRQALLPLELILPAIDLVFKSNSSVLVQLAESSARPRPPATDQNPGWNFKGVVPADLVQVKQTAIWPDPKGLERGRRLVTLS